MHVTCIYIYAYCKLPIHKLIASFSLDNSIVFHFIEYLIHSYFLLSSPDINKEDDDLDESRFSKNPLSAMKLPLAGTSKIDDLKGMDHDEFMKTMMEEYDLNTESLHTDVE